MSDPKPPRTPGGDLGTADRIEADTGHYWVRLWSKQAVRREGAAMVNCLRDGGYDNCAGSDDPEQDGLWSLRNRNGRSVALARIMGGLPPITVTMFLGPKNSMASPLAYRQLRHVKAFFFDYFARLMGVSPAIKEPVVIAPDGATYRWDKAPKPLRLADHDARMERRRAAGEKHRLQQIAHEATFDDLPIPAGQATSINDIRPVTPQQGEDGAYEVSLSDGRTIRVPMHFQRVPDPGLLQVAASFRAMRAQAVALLEETRWHTDQDGRAFMISDVEPETVEVEGEITYDAFVETVATEIRRGAGL